MCLRHLLHSIFTASVNAPLVIGEKGKMTPRADYVMHKHMCE